MLDIIIIVCCCCSYPDTMLRKGHIKMKNIILNPKEMIIQKVRQIGKQVKYSNIRSLV